MEVPAAMGVVAGTTTKLVGEPPPTGIVTMLLVEKDCEIVSCVNGFAGKLGGSSSTMSFIPTAPTLYPALITFTVDPPDCADNETLRGEGGPGNACPLTSF